MKRILFSLTVVCVMVAINILAAQQPPQAPGPQTAAPQAGVPQRGAGAPQRGGGAPGVPAGNAPARGGGGGGGERPQPLAAPPAVMPPPATPIVSMTAPTPDPRVGLT